MRDSITKWIGNSPKDYNTLNFRKMGLGQNAGRSTFVGIKDGKLQVKKDHQIETFGYLSGLMVDIQIRDDEYEGKKYKKLSIYLVDEDERFCLDIKVGSAYWVGFCMTVPNVDLNYPVTLIPSMKTEAGKEKRTLFISQAGKALKRFWTKDNPGQLPRLKQIEFKGEKVWDNTDQNNWLMEYLTHQIKPKLPHPVMGGPASDIGRPAGAPPAGGPTDASHITEPIDDLPF